MKPMPTYLEMMAQIEALRIAGRHAEAEAMNAKLIVMTQGGVCPMKYEKDK